MHITGTLIIPTNPGIMEFINRLLSPDASSPLLFTQANFWIFFGVVVFIFSLVYSKVNLRNTFLFLASLFFYYRSGGVFSLLLLSIIVFNFFLAKASALITDRKPRIGILLLSLFINLGLLIYFKYTSFFISALNSVFGSNLSAFSFFIHGRIMLGSSFSFTDFIVPIGISFYTFQLISYSIEVYRRKVEPIRNFMDFGLYISFFPNLVSGPLVKPQEFIPQIYQPYRLTREDFGSAIFLIMTGLVKKIVIADYLSVNFIGRVFENPHLFSGFENMMAIYGYTLQIYFDFSGYTDIAIGLALLLGFRLPPNFNAPYRARNINEFWKRWHMSLTTWFRDYLFLPLAYRLSGKMEKKYYLKVKTEKWIYLTGILVTFLLCGLWHGAAVNFVIWGGIHGIALVIHKFLYPKTRLGSHQRSLRSFLSGLFTFHFIVFTWIIFRIPDLDSFTIMIGKIFRNFHTELIPQVLLSYWKIMVIMLTGYTMVWFPENLKIRIRNSFIRCPDPLKALMVLIIIIFVYQFKVAGIQPFIYFQF
jgi:alginate O-acetyltransferase complex protein AlgI